MPKINKSLGIIPARFLSSRFPGKPLVEIEGKTMIQRVFEQVSKSLVLDAAVVATDDDRIFDHVQSFGGNAVMTAASHPSGTDRCAEVTQMAAWSVYDFVVNIQGDEPFIQPQQIDLAISFLQKNKDFGITTLVKKIERKEELFNPNVVKAVFGQGQKALYFSRHPIPFLRNKAEDAWLENGVFYKHIGLYAFRREVLLHIAGLPPGKLEMAESLEQLRWLENGISIGVALTEFESRGIDTPEDLQRLEGV